MVQAVRIDATSEELAPTYPKPPGGGVRRDTPRPSAVFSKTVLPHQVATLFKPIVPSRGNCKQKKSTTVEIATPESIAAERT